MKILLPLALVLLSLPAAGAELKPVPVVELFTSQGCNSCPPADALLGEMARRDDVLALSLHVDYWDYLGWKDVFSSPWATARQRAYAKSFGTRSIYTPQMVVDGADGVVGSDARAVAARLARAKPAAFTAEVEGSRAVLRFAATGARADIVLATFAPAEPVTITRGENAGNTFTYRNVVRRLELVGAWNGRAGEVALMLPAATAGRARALLVQGENTGIILGAVRLPDGTAPGI